MSVRVSTLVWGRSQAKGHVLLLLLALADQANDEGYCWPKQSTLARRLRLGSDRAVRKAIDAAQALGELTVMHRTQDGRFIGNAYQINLHVLRRNSDLWDAPPEPQFRPDKATTGTTVPVPPEPQFRSPPEPQFRTINVSNKHQDNRQEKDGAENRAGQKTAQPETNPPNPNLPPVSEKTKTADKGSRQDNATTTEDVPRGAALPVEIAIPDALRHREGFAEAWGEWVAYRKARRLSCLPVTLRAQLGKLEREPDPVAVIEQSITNGWNGLFPLRGGPKAGKPRTQAEANERFIQGVQDTMSAVKGVFDD